MPRNITVTFADGSKHVYQNAPDDLTPEQVTQRAQKDFGKSVTALDGGRNAPAKPKSDFTPDEEASGLTGSVTDTGEYERPSILSAMGRAAKNVAADIGVGMAAIPDLMAAGGRLAERGIVMGGATVAEPVLRGLGAKGAADWVKREGEDAYVGTGAYKQRRTLGEMFEATAASPPEQRVTRLPAQFLGGMMSPIPGVTMKPSAKPRPQLPAVKTAGQEIIEEGEKAGVRVLTSDVKPPKTFIGKSAQAIGERIPLSGTGGIRQAQQAERIQAVKGLLAEHGADDAARALTDDVAADLAKTRSAQLTKFSAAKQGVINSFGEAKVPLSNTMKALDDKIAELEARGTTAAVEVANTLKGYRTAWQNKTLPQVEAIRADELSNAFKGTGLGDIQAVGEKAVRSIYKAINDDMGAFIAQQGGKGAFSKWKGANQQLAAMAGELKTGAFKRALNSAETTPENVANLLFNSKPSEVARLYANLSPQGKAKAQGAILQRAMEKAGGLDNLSPDKFVNEIERLGKNVGVVFGGNDRARIDGLTRLLNATQRAATASVSPPTGVQAVPYVMGAGFTQLFGVTGGIGAAGATGLIARIYESAPVRNALLKIGRSAPGSAAERVSMKQAANLITRGLMSQAGKMGPAMNENAIASSVAGEGQEQQREYSSAP